MSSEESLKFLFLQFDAIIKRNATGFAKGSDVYIAASKTKVLKAIEALESLRLAPERASGGAGEGESGK